MNVSALRQWAADLDRLFHLCTPNLPTSPGLSARCCPRGKTGQLLSNRVPWLLSVHIFLPPARAPRTRSSPTGPRDLGSRGASAWHWWSSGWTGLHQPAPRLRQLQVLADRPPPTLCFLMSRASVTVPMPHSSSQATSCREPCSSGQKQCHCHCPRASMRGGPEQPVNIHRNRHRVLRDPSVGLHAACFLLRQGSWD